MKFTIECEMKDRQFQDFVSMLCLMQYCGVIGASRVIGLYADGDGDFNPKFVFKDESGNVVDVDKSKLNDIDIDKGPIIFDAG